MTELRTPPTTRNSGLTPSDYWQLSRRYPPLDVVHLGSGDFAQVRFQTKNDTSVQEDLWSRVIEYIHVRREYWAVLDDKPRLFNMPMDYQFMLRPVHIFDFVTQGENELVLVDIWGRKWGRYKNSGESDYPIQSSMTQILDANDLGVMGDGCFRGAKAIKRAYRGIAYKDKDGQQVSFDRAWGRVSRNSRQVLWVHYVSNATLRKKAEALRVEIHDYFSNLKVAQTEIWREIEQGGVASNG